MSRADFLDPVTGNIRPTSGYARLLERFASTRVGARVFVKVAPHLDRRIVRLSGGRMSMALIRPVALLGTVGAKSARRRSTPLLYFRDGENIVLIASSGGNPWHPSWYHNLRANPECTLFYGGQEGRYTARQSMGEERERLWEEANKLYRGYDVYQGRTGGREIPVMVLEAR